MKSKRRLTKIGVRGILSPLNYSLGIIFNVRVSRSRQVRHDRIAKRIFSSCEVHLSEEGYWRLKPMPSGDDLDRYYGSAYWSSRGGKANGVTVRDMIHYGILKCEIPETLGVDHTFLNFGAGHGGISHLLWMDGLTIVNVEPSDLPIFYDSRWSTLREITGVPDCSIDLLYGSHSLEHVNDIDFFKNEFRRVLKPDGICFMEVPNARCPSNGAQLNRVDIPHTYYFEKKFFENWFDDVLICETFDQTEQIESWIKARNDSGTVIRALGRFGKKVQ